MQTGKGNISGNGVAVLTQDGCQLSSFQVENPTQCTKIGESRDDCEQLNKMLIYSLNENMVDDRKALEGLHGVLRGKDISSELKCLFI